MSRKRSTSRQLRLFVEQATHANGNNEPPANTVLITPHKTAGTHLSGSATPASLWLCIGFPEFMLEALGATEHSPSVVISGEGSAAVLQAINQQAGHVGITTSMSLNTALALAPELIVYQRASMAETAMLKKLASWALSYTPVVSINPDGALLLEVKGSLSLFGGLQQLRKRLQRDLHERGHRNIMASAPAPKAALWLVRAGAQLDCRDLPELPGLLGRLSLECLGWPLKLRHKLMQMGVSTLGECFRLPRDGFARRIGPEYLRDLDQGLGKQPELLPHHHEPDVFDSHVEFAQETLVAGDMENAAYQLLARLGAFLRERQAKVQQLRLRFEHYQQPSTPLQISLREASGQTDYLFELLQLQMARQSLTAPVTGLHMRATVVPLASFSNGNLFAGQQEDATALTSLIERLRARLGSQQVHGIAQVADYRPERAWCSREPVPESSSANHPINPSADVPGEAVSRMRPLWLLQQPRTLDTHQGWPVEHSHRKLHFLSDAERIETGWWDGNDVLRDYYNVTARSGEHWWVFRDRMDSRWYLHGIYG
jgi:protein ImuB